MVEERAKFVMCGKQNVGKSSLIHRLVHGTFTDISHTIPCDWYVFFTQTRSISAAGETIEAKMWDTAGQERYGPLPRMYFKAAHGAMLVYDISERHSFEQVVNWVQIIRQNEPQAACVLVGNKCDLSAGRAVSFEEGCGLANTLGVPFVETSAKTGLGVMEAFQAVVAGIVHSRSLR